MGSFTVVPKRAFYARDSGRAPVDNDSHPMSAVPHPATEHEFSSPPPKVRLVNAFERPFENVVATARTCYSSKGIVTEDQASARPERRDALAKSIYAAGHHTTFQHAHFQFAIENVSRQFLWSFLHSHPFYNSEQVSQRYVEVRSGKGSHLLVKHPTSGKEVWVAVHTKKDAGRLGNRILREAGVE